MSNGVDEGPVALVRCRRRRHGSQGLAGDPPDRRRINVLRDWLDAEVETGGSRITAAGIPDLMIRLLEDSQTWRG